MEGGRGETVTERTNFNKHRNSMQQQKQAHTISITALLVGFYHGAVAHKQTQYVNYMIGA